MIAPPLSPIEDIIADAKAGRMFVLVDDEDRENEGDLVIPAEFADAEAVNFMAKHGRGLICLAMTGKRVQELQLNLMAHRNESRHQTAFTVSIEAREGISTGISAADRARTIQTAIDPAKGATDIVSPGHVFPLVARDGGVLVRTGHTEAAVDIARLAGLNPSGVICEIMNDDGSMARMNDLIPFAKTHGLKIATIADLIAYRRRREKLVERIVETPFTSSYGGEFKMIVYQSGLEYAEHIALVKGDISGSSQNIDITEQGEARSEGAWGSIPHSSSPIWVRMHAINPLSDVLGDTHDGDSSLLHASMRMIAAHGSGVVVLLREPIRTALSDRLRERRGEATEANTDLRDYGIGAQILLDLGISDMVLLSNSKRAIVGLEGYGLNVRDWKKIT